MLKLALPCSQTDEYLKYHHRTFIQQLMEAEIETCIRALTGLSSQSSGEEWEEWECEQRNQDHNGDTHWNNLPELMGVYPPASQGRKQLKSKLVPVNVGDNCMAASDYGATGSGNRIYPYCLFWLFGNLFSLDRYLSKPGYSTEGLGPSPKQCASPLWGVDGGGVGGCVEGNGRMEGMGTWVGIFKKSN